MLNELVLKCVSMAALLLHPADVAVSGAVAASSTVASDADKLLHVTP